MCGRVGKHTDELAQELVANTEGKTDCTEWHTDGWDAYERVLTNEASHYISKALTQRLERTMLSCVNKRSRWHRRQNKFSKIVEPDAIHCTFSHQLLQLDLAAFMLGNYNCVGVQS